MNTANDRLVASASRLARWSTESGKIGWALLWLLGVPLPVLLIIYLIRGH